MTFDEAQRTFRIHKTYEAACTYLVIASERKTDDAIDGDTLFNAVGEVANWLSASDEHLRAFEMVKQKTLLGKNSHKALEAQVIRFPVERRRRPSSMRIAGLPYAPMLFWITLSGMLIEWIILGMSPSRRSGAGD